jgi:hypothetical protein
MFELHFLETDSQSCDKSASGHPTPHIQPTDLKHQHSHTISQMSSSSRKSTSSSHTRGKRADPYTRPATTIKKPPTGQLQRQVSFGVGNTMRRVADLKENHDRVVAMGGTARLTRTQALKLEQYTTVQTRSRPTRRPLREPSHSCCSVHTHTCIYTSQAIASHPQMLALVSEMPLMRTRRRAWRWRA